jgi:hypothetical protein
MSRILVHYLYCLLLPFDPYKVEAEVVGEMDPDWR